MVSYLITLRRKHDSIQEGVEHTQGERSGKAFDSHRQKGLGNPARKRQLMPQTSTGRAHVARGFEGSKADVVAHVCFDSYFGSPCIFFYTPQSAAECAKRKQGVYGTREGNTQKRTGYGAKVTPAELNAKPKDFVPDPEFFSQELGERGESEVRKLYESDGWTMRRAERDEQIKGKYDFEATKGTRSLKIEVKSRGEDKGYPELFVQTHEKNDQKRIT